MLIVGQVGWGNLHPTRLTRTSNTPHQPVCLLSRALLIAVT